MPENPRTLSLEAAEWSALSVFCVNAIAGSMAQIAQTTESARVTDAQAQQLRMGLDRAGHLLEAWRRASQVVAQVAVPPQEPAKINGPAPSKPKGWPKGRKRKQVLQPPAN